MGPHIIMGEEATRRIILLTLGVGVVVVVALVAALGWGLDPRSRWRRRRSDPGRRARDEEP